MEKQFATYEQSLALKELGFDKFMREDCLAYFNTSNSNYHLETRDWWCLPENDFQYALSAPLKQQVFKFFREIYAISFFIIDIYPAEYQLNIHNGSNYEQTEFETYEEAESACIDKLIEIVKNR